MSLSTQLKAKQSNLKDDLKLRKSFSPTLFGIKASILLLGMLFLSTTSFSQSGITIGDKVWFDANKNGFQDLGETGIDNIPVLLFFNGTQVGSTTTASGGFYQFTDANVTGGIIPDTGYVLRIANAVGGAQPAPLVGYGLSPSNQGLDDNNDSDGEAVGNNAEISFFTDTIGVPVNTYDFGFYNKLPELSIFKTVSNSNPTIGSLISYTIKIKNTGEATATNVTMTDNLPTGVTYQSATVIRGTGSFSGSTWNAGSIPVGDSAVIIISVMATSEGIHYNTASVTATETERDLTDNAARVCHSVPVNICGASYTMRLPGVLADYSTISWYKNGNLIVSNNNLISLVINDDATTGAGTYHVEFTSSDPTLCSLSSCCDLVVEKKCFDLALAKRLAAGQASTVSPGDVVNFTITIYNQGDIAADSIQLTDYIPTGMTLSDATWTSISPTQARKMLSVANGAIQPGGLASGQSMTADIQLTVNANFVGDSLVNYAEISDAQDPNGNAVTDIDSTPDANNANDDGGAPSSPADNYTAGNGKAVGGAPGDGNTATDEDDHDPAVVKIIPNPFDLALYKRLTTGQNYFVAAGDTVSFTIAVVNQGEVDATQITVTDSIPSNMTFFTQAGWTSPSNNKTTYTFAGPLAPDDTLFTTIRLIVNAPLTAGTIITNWAEISSAVDGFGNPVTDIDSDPDSNIGNDKFLVDNEIVGDGKGGGDEDDHDPASVEIIKFDLALFKQVAGNQLVAPGDTVQFNITVVNQGDVAASNIVVTDYLPAELSFITQAGWSLVAGNPTRTLTGVTLAPGQSTTTSILLQVNSPLASNTRITNWAEITSATDDSGHPQTDIDSNPDAVNDDKFLVDDDITGDGKNGGDEDDHDRADLYTQPFDLALIKTLAPGQSRNVTAGDTVDFRITVVNQGAISASNIVVTDYVPSNMSFITQAGWTVISGNPTRTLTGVTLAPGQSTFVDIRLRVNAPLTANTAITNWAEITSATDDSGHPQTDIDSNPDNTQSNDTFITDNDLTGDGKMGEDEDDHDPETVYVNPFDLALYKVLAPGQNALVKPGDTVTFRINVVNQGVVDASQIAVTDYIPSNMSFITQAGWTQTGATASTTLPGILAAGASTFVDIKLKVNAPLASNTKIDNWAEISSARDKNGNPVVDIDSDPDANNTDRFITDNEINGDGKMGGDEDDHDVASVYTQPFDLALYKKLAPNQNSTVSPGEIVTFRITVVNQGQIPASNIVITDYIPSNMSFVAQAGWSAVGLLATASPITTVLNPGDSTSLTIQLRVNSPLAAGTIVTNWAEISSATDNNGNPVTDIDSNPDQTNDDKFLADNDINGDGKNGGDEDDHDKAEVNINGFDLALYKQVAGNQLVAPGDTVLFNITVVNQGDIPASNIVITDYIPAEMSYVNQAGWVNGGSTATRTLTGITLNPGQSTTTSILLQVNSPLPSNTRITNWAEISSVTDNNGNPVTDVDSNPDGTNDDKFLVDDDITGDGKNGGDEDDHDRADLFTQPFDLALMKQLAPNQSRNVTAGDTVNFRITVLNQGAIAATNIVVTDYIPSSMSFVTQAGWVSAGSTATTTLTGVTLAPGQTTTVDIKLKVNAPLSANTAITNWAEITSATDDSGHPQSDIDSDPDNNQTNDRFVTNDDVYGDGKMGEDEDDHDPETVYVNPFDLALYKVLAPNQSANVNPGDTVTFRINVVNQGVVDASQIVVTDYIPTQMSFVTQAGWTQSGATASTTLPGILAAGASTFVDIKLKVNAPLASNTKIDNWAEISSARDRNGNPVVDIDSDPDANNTDRFITDNEINGDGKNGGDEDDHDIASIYTTPFDLALYKKLAPGQSYEVSPGSIVNYRITVVNQGQIPASNIVISDYIPSNMSFVAQAGWTQSGSVATTTYTGIVNPGDSTSVTLQLRVNSPLTAGTVVTNWAEISSATDDNGNPQQDVDSNPDQTNDDKYLVDNDINGDGKNGGDEDDHDPADIVINVFDLALFKQVAGNQLVAPGDTVQFNITVVNQGDVAASNIQITDYIPAEMSFVTQPDWVNGGSTATRTLTGVTLAPGQSTTTSILLQVNSPLPSNTRIVNWAEISGALDGNGNPVTDVDSDPDAINDDTFLVDDYIDGDGKNGGDEDDHDRADLYTQPFDLALMKQLAPGQTRNVNAGDTVNFRITVVNQGAIAADNIQIADYIPSNMSFVTQAGWSLSGAIAYRTLTGVVLAPGQTTTVDIKLRVNAPLSANTAITNWAEITSATDDSGHPQTDIDSDPDNIQSNDKYVTNDDVYGDGKMGEDEDDHDPETVYVNPFDLALYKILDPGQTANVNPGDTVSYRIVVVNQGVVDAANIVVTDYIPTQMSFVTQAGWTQLGATASTTIPGVLAAGDSVFVTLKLRLNAPQPANTTVTNWAEVSSVTDKNGNPVVDIDSDPDNNSTNDKYLVDNDINGDGKNGGDEDDHDKADIYVQPFDLALVKRLAPGQNPFVAPGQTANFEIKVVNQGKVPASNIVITDYIPAELQFVTQPNWSAVGNIATRTALTQVLFPGDSAIVSIQLMVRNGLTTMGTITNWAEISSATDQNGNPQQDVDSYMDQTLNNDQFFIDDYIDGNGKNGGDEDDHDKAVLSLEPLSLGNLVWYDDNNNGLWDVNEKGVQNVQVILFDGTGTTPLDTVYTDVNGHYLFEGLMPGDYKVKLNSGIPVGYTSSTGDGKYDYDMTGFFEPAKDPDDNINHDDNGTQMGATMIMSDVIRLDFGQEPVDDEDNNSYSNLTVDFGIHKLDTFDLALRKVIDPAQHFPVLIGDDVKYVITVYNQGTVTAKNIQLKDYLPAGVNLSVNDVNGWVGAGTTATLTTNDTIAPGGSKTYYMLATVVDGASGTKTNYAEISQADDDNDASNTYPTDIDSTPDDTNGNDDGGAPNTASDDVITGNGKASGGAPGDSNPATDEDDHDPAQFSLGTFDLALIKTTNQTAPVKVGDVVQFSITVTNQGLEAADSIVVEDRFPQGFGLHTSSIPTWTAVGTDRAKTTLVGDLLPGQSINVNINLVVLPNVTSGEKVNRAEIVSAQDTSGRDRSLDDVDSTPDNVNGNDDGGKPNSPTDNVITGNGKDSNGAPGDENPATDEDDEDPATVNVIFDLALRKVVSATQKYPILAGDDVDFDITVINQGGSDAYNVTVNDYLPTGLTLSPLDNNGWNGNGSTLTSAVIAKIPFGGSVTIKLKARVSAGVGKGTMVNYSEIGAADDDTDPSNTPPTDIDSTPDDNSGNDDGGQPYSPADDYVNGDGKATGGTPGDGNTATDEDDHDPAPFVVDIFDLALRKTTTATVVKAGDIVPFTITLFNQGTVQARNVVVEDRIPTGFALATTGNAGWSAQVGDRTSYTVVGPILPGASTTVTINLLVLSNVTSGDHVNYAEVLSAQDSLNRDRSQNDIDSQPDNNNTNDDGGAVGTPSDDVITGNGKDPNGTPGDGNPATDEDDHDPAKVTVIFDLALKKVVSPSQVFPILPGDDVDFVITVINQGGSDAYNVVVTDYLPQYLTLSPLDVNSWSGSSSIITSDTIRKIAVGDSARLYLKARLIAGAPAGMKVNYAEISSADDNTDPSDTYPTDIDSTPDGVNGNDDGGQPNSPADNYVNGNGKAPGGAPGDGNTATDEDDHDPAQFRTDIFDLALRKTTTRTTPVRVGDDVPFEITVFNQGTLIAKDVVVEDRIPAGFSVSPLAANSIWTLVDTSTFKITIAGPIAVGDSSKVTIWLRANPTLIQGDHVNYAEITAAKDDLGNDRSNDDVDSTPDTNNTNDRYEDDVINEDGKNTNGDEDDHDGATVKSVFDLALRKVISPEEEDDRVYPTEDITFRITVINQGSVVAKNIYVTDSIPTGFVLNDQDWIWDNVRNVAVINLSNPLNPLDSVTVDITLKAVSVVPGYRINWSEISRADDVAGNTPEDIDSTPDGNLGNDDGGLPGSPADNYVDGDGKAPGGTPRDGNTATDEDDQDPALVRLAIFDLAMKKHVYRERRIEYGDTVSFQMTIINQGTEPAYNIQLTDSIMPGFVFEQALNPTWTIFSSNQVQTTLAGPLAAGASTTAKITFRVSPDFTGRHLTNFAEISKADDDLNPNDAPPVDVDSNPDTNYGNDKYVTDNNVDGNGKNGEDEDDHDPATITVWPPLPPKCEPPVVSTVIKVNSTCGNNIGSIDIQMAGPNSGYTYNWSPAVSSTNSASELWAGTYFVTITKIGETIPGCDTVIAVVVGNSPYQPTSRIISSTPETCDQKNGTVTLSPNTAYFTYNWSDGGTGAIRTGLAAGMYQVTVTEKYNDCFDVFQVEVKKNNPLTSTIRIDRPAVCDSATGKATVLISGGSGNYKIAWEDSVFTATREGLISTQYYVYIKDNVTGCENFNSVWIPSVQPPSSVLIVPSTVTLNCVGDSTGTVNVAVSPNTATYKIVDNYGYTYTNGQLTVGKYKVVAFNGDCVYQEKPFEVIEPKLIDAEVSLIPGDCGGNGRIKLDTVFGGNPAYRYDWADIPGNNNSKDRINLVGGLYDLTITDTKGCFVVKQINLPNGPDTTKPVIIPLPNLQIACNDPVPAPTTPTFTDNCDPNPTAVMVEEEFAGNVCVDSKTIKRTWTVTDASGNKATYTQTITVVDNIKPVLTAVTPFITAECQELPIPEEPTATDNCDDIVRIEFNEVKKHHGTGCKESYTLIRTWKAIDNCGNFDTVSQRIEVIDRGEPFFISQAPNDTTIACGRTIPAAPGLLIVGDNCDANPYTIFKEEKVDVQCTGTYTIRRSWTATDACGNTTVKVQNISIIDTLRPTFTFVPANVTVDCGKVPAAVQPRVTDVCTPSNVTITMEETQELLANGNKVLTRTWTATDACGNSSTAQQKVTEKACAPDCSITMNSTVSACQYNTISKKSEATLTVNVSWGLYPIGQTIQVTAAGQTKTINPATATSPVALTFTITANGSTGNTIVAKYADGTCIVNGTYNAPESCETFDLALVKKLATGQSTTVNPGDNVKFTITVYNQGTVPATQVQVTDYIPTGMSLADLTWTATGNVAKRNNVIASIAPGSSASVDITLKVNADYQGGKLVNTAEISSAKDDKGNTPTDIDSTPDDTNGNTPGETNPKDDVVNEDGKNGGDEDDQDIAPITVNPPTVFDLAMIKRLANGQPTSVNPGDNVKYTITVYNQGNVAATQIQITDYIPTGMTLNDANWTATGSKATLKTPISGPLAPGTSTSVDITLKLDANYSGDSTIVNGAEISSVKDDKGNTPTDKDSTPDDTDNDKYVTDDDTTGDGKNGGDEDDNDKAPISVIKPVLVFDLALVKTLASGQATVVKPGDNVTFTITVINQGNVPATQIQITDYIPTGMTLADNNWTASAGKATLNSLIAGPLNPGSSTNVNITLKVNSDFTGTSLTNNAEISSVKDNKGNTPTDVDSTPDSNNNDTFVTDNDITGNGKNGGDEDDHDPATIGVVPNPTQKFDLALIKRLAVGQPSIVTAGETVKFTITVVNQGDIAATQVQVADYIPSGLTLEDNNWTVVNGKAVLKTPIAGPIAAGSTSSVDITFRVDANFTGQSITNKAEISSAKDNNGNTPTDVDSTPDDSDNDRFITDDDITGNGKNGGDEDDHDPATIGVVPPQPKVFDLALTKTVASGQAASFKPGDNVTFAITVYNQGDVTATNVEVSDYVPSGLTLADASWTLSAGKAKRTIAGPIAAGASTTVNITFTIDANFTGTSLTNKAEISAAKDGNGNTPTDTDSTPDDTDNDRFLTDNDTSGNGKTGGDEDDHDPATIPVVQTPKVFDLALTKTVASGQAASFKPGDNVTFAITVYNQGDVTATNVEVSDYVPSGLTLADASWTLSAGKAKRTIAGPIAAGASTTVNITFTIDANFTGTSLTNKAEISAAKDGNGNTPTDTDSTPDDTDNDRFVTDNDTSGNGKTGGDEDDHDPATIPVVQTPKVFDLALTKTVASGQSVTFRPGDNVTFAITVYNQGDVTATNVEVSDYVPSGLTLADASWTLSAGKAKRTIAGPIAAGASTTVNITFTIDANFTGTSLTNKAEISAAKDGNGNTPTDTDSTPDDTDNDKFVTDNDITGNGKTGGDEDDHDPATIPVIPVVDCTLNISAVQYMNVKNCDCNGTSGGAKGTVEVTVTWSSIPTGQTIIVKLGTATQTINPATTPSPAKVQFANVKGTGTLSAALSNGTCTKNENYSIPQGIGKDDTPPVLSGVPNNVTVECGNIPSAPNVTATDDCADNVQVTFKEETIGNPCSCGYSIKRTWTAVDGCNNSTSRTQTITITDKTAPILTFNNPQLVGKKSGDTVVVSCKNPFIYSEADVKVTDNCCNNINVVFDDYADAISGDCKKDGYKMLMFCQWTATDGCGNKSDLKLIVKVVDNTAPVLSVRPADVTLNCGAAIPPAATVTATDDCDNPVNVTYREETIGTQCGCTYGVKRTWIATDSCGNVAFHTQTISINDKTAPVISAVHPLLQGLHSGDTVVVSCMNPFIFAPEDVTVTDNCCTDKVVVEFEDYAEAVSGNCAKDGYLTLMFCQWTATDQCGNTSNFRVIIKVVDNTAPVLSALPADINLNCNGGGTVPAAQTITATDDCDDEVPVIFTEERTNGKCAGSFTIVRTWKAIDHCGNIVIHKQTITSGDVTSPVLSATPSNLTVDICKGETVPSAATLTANDNCKGATPVTYNEVVGQGCDYTITRTWKATDDCGNETVHTQTITVKGAKPSITSVQKVDPICSPTGTITISATSCNGASLKYSINGGTSYQNSNVFTGLSGGTYNVMVANADGSCPVSYSTPVVLTGSGGDLIPESNVTVSAPNCGSSYDYCLPINFSDINNYNVSVNGQAYFSNFKACGEDTVKSYLYQAIPGRGAEGPYRLDSWIVGGNTYSGQFNDAAGLVSLMNQLDPNGNWKQYPTSLTIKGGRKGVSYGQMNITQMGTTGKAILTPDMVLQINGSAVTLTVGTHTIIVSNKANGCADTVKVTVNGKNPNTTCGDIITAKTAILVASVCANGANFCTGLPASTFSKYMITDNGRLFSGKVENCGTNSAAINLAVGTHKLIFTDNTTCCSDTVTVKVVCLKTDKVTKTIFIGQIDATPVNVEELPGQYKTTNIVKMASDRSVSNATMKLENGNVVFTGKNVGTEEFVVVVTDEYGINDTTIYTITVADRASSVTQAIEEEPVIYNAISPNGDGLNDKLIIDNIEKFENNELKIFDKTGRLIYETKNYQNNWDGTFNGQTLPVGTYFYQFDTGTKLVKGFIEVKYE